MVQCFRSSAVYIIAGTENLVVAKHSVEWSMKRNTPEMCELLSRNEKNAQNTPAFSRNRLTLRGKDSPTFEKRTLRRRQYVNLYTDRSHMDSRPRPVRPTLLVSSLRM